MSVTTLPLHPPCSEPYHAPNAGSAPLSPEATVGHRSLGAVLLVAGLLAASCGSEPQARPQAPGIAPIPAEALPGRAGQPVDLDAGQVSTDALDVGELEAILSEPGVGAGTAVGV